MFFYDTSGIFEGVEIMIRFEYPSVLFALTLIVPLIFILYRRYKQTESLLLCIYTKKYLERTLFYTIVFWKLLLSMCMSVLVILSLSQPVVITADNDNGFDKKYIIISIDISKSMYVEEGSTTRMHTLIEYIRGFMRDNAGSQFMIIGFTDKIVQLTPFTDNEVFLSNVLQQIEKSPLITGSTDYMNVVSRLVPLIMKEKKLEDMTGNIHFIFASDGESHTATPNNILRSISRIVDSMSIISVGTEEAKMIMDNGKYIIDGRGVIATSIAHPALLSRIAKHGGSTFINIEKEQSTPSLSASYNISEGNPIAWIGWLGLMVGMFFYIIMVVL